MSSTSDSEGEPNHKGNVEDWTSEYLGDVDSIDEIQLTTDYETETDNEIVNESIFNENCSNSNKKDDNKNHIFIYCINKFYSLFKFDSDFTLVNIFKFLSILILSAMSFILIEFIYYRYRIDNMIGTIDDLPNDSLFHQLHQNKCNKVLNQYNNQLDNCLNKNDNYINCLNDFHKSITKNSNFCNWNVELLYSKIYAKVMLKESSTKFNNLISSIECFFKNEIKQKLYHFYTDFTSNSIKIEKKIVNLLSDFNKNYKLKAKFVNFTNDFDNILNDLVKNLVQGSQIVYNTASEKTYNIVNKFGKMVKKYI